MNQDDDAEKVIREHLSTALRGPNWNAVIKALAVGDKINWDNARAAFDQLFLSSASGPWLDRKAGDLGIIRPEDVGMDNELFRKLAIKTNSNKVVHEAIKEILEVYYGQDSLRAFVETELDENYNLTTGLDLTWIFDEKQSFRHTFTTSQFTSITAAKALEVAFALTKTMRDAGSRGFASVSQSPTTGKYRVRIYSGSLGLGSSVRVTGGSAQNVLQFPKELQVYLGTITGATGYIWAYTHPNSTTSRVSLSIDLAMSFLFPLVFPWSFGGGSLTSILIDLTSVEPGDYVLFGVDAQTGITGAYPIKNVSISWSGTILTQSFDVDYLTFNSTALQLSNSAYRFYRPTKNTINAGERTIVVAQTRPGQVDIKIPATTQAVSRGPNQASYGRLNLSQNINKIVRNSNGLVTITTPDPHGLSVGSWIQIDDVIQAQELPYIDPNNSAVYPSSFTFAASHASIVAETQTPPVAITEDAASTVLDNGQVLICGGFTRAAGPINRTTGFISSGTATGSTNCNRFQSGLPSTITNGTEADGATAHTHTWIATSDMPFVSGAREHLAVSPYLGGAIATGGLVTFPFFGISSASEKYTVNGPWTSLPVMKSQRCGHQQVQLDNGYVMVIGGANTAGTALNSTEIYDGVSWTYGPAMNVPRTDFKVVRLSNGNLMAIGGRTMGRGHDLDPKTLALWRLDEEYGPTAVDATGSYPLTHTGSPIVSNQGKINRCLDFNSPGRRLVGPGNATAAGLLLGEWTVELWFTLAGATNTFLTYGGATESAADNILLNVGTDSSNRVNWKWENGSGVDVSATQATAITSHPAFRANFFNHLALKKSFNSPKNSISASRTSNVTTLTFDTPHGWSTGNNIFFVSHDPVAFSSGSKTILSTPTPTTITYSDIGVDVPYWLLHGVAGRDFDVTLFLNSVQVETWTAQTNAESGTSGQWNVAYNPEDVGSNFKGLLDDIRVSFCARTPEEIRENFLRGWGNQTSAAAVDTAVGAITDTCEIYDGVSWTLIQPMALGRAFHGAVVLPNDYVLVHGGLGYDTSSLPAIVNETIGLWPSNSLKETEIYDPVVKKWSSVKSAGIRRHGHLLTYDSVSNQITAHGGISLNQNILDVDNCGHPEVLDLQKKTWRTVPVGYRTSCGAFTGTAVGGNVLLYGGFDRTGATNTRGLALINSSLGISGPGLNGHHRVYDVLDPNTFSLQTARTAGEMCYSSNFGPKYPGDDGISLQVRSSSFWKIYTGSRSSNVTTLVLNFPTGYTTHGISVGDLVWVNSKHVAFGSGVKVVTYVSSTSIQYAEIASDQAGTVMDGSVSQNFSPSAIAIKTASQPQPSNNPGPFVFDPDNGLAITSTQSTVVGFPLYANQNYEEIEIDDTGGQGLLFPDTVGYLVFGFGTESQTAPIKYLGRYKNSPTTVRLILDYGFKLLTDQNLGSSVSLLSQRAPYAPVAAPGSAYVTGSSAGRVAAEASVLEASAAGIEVDVTITYPGDRGLGGEDHPTHGAPKLSGVVGVFAGDEEDEEVQELRGKE